MRAILAFTLGLAACGLSVTGVDPAPANDGGAPASGASGSPGASSGSSSSSSSSSSGSADASVDAAPDAPTPAGGCAALGNVNRCLYFDPPEPQFTPWGFDSISYNDSTSMPAIGLEASPVGAAAQNAFGVTRTPSPTDAKHDVAAIALFEDFKTKHYLHVSLDVDVAIDSFDASYATLVGFHFSGNGCDEWSGLAVRKAELLHFDLKTGTVAKIGTYADGVTFHVHLEANPGTATPSPDSISINGAAAHTFQKALPFPSCDYGAGYVGSFFASTKAADTYHVRFDQLVMRAE